MFRALHDIDKYLKDHKDFEKTATTALLVWAVCLRSDLAQTLARQEHEPPGSSTRGEYLTIAQVMRTIIISIDDELVHRGVYVDMSQLD